jgi:hypothetical protein
VREPFLNSQYFGGAGSILLSIASPAPQATTKCVAVSAVTHSATLADSMSLLANDRATVDLVCRLQ